jgi:hypothetical protein
VLPGQHEDLATPCTHTHTHTCVCIFTETISHEPVKCSLVDTSTFPPICPHTHTHTHVRPILDTGIYKYIYVYICTHLQTSSHEPINVFPSRHKHLSTHMSTLLSTVALVLKMNARSPAVYHQFGQTHNCSHASVSGISVGDDGTQVVDASLKLALGPLCLELLAIVELYVCNVRICIYINIYTYGPLCLELLVIMELYVCNVRICIYINIYTYGPLCLELLAIIKLYVCVKDSAP